MPTVIKDLDLITYIFLEIKEKAFLEYVFIGKLYGFYM